MVPEGRFEVVVAGAEAFHRLVEQTAALVLVQVRYAFDDGRGAGVDERGVLAGHEQFDDDAARVGGHGQVQPSSQLR